MLALIFPAGGFVLFIPWRLAAERGADFQNRKNKGDYQSIALTLSIRGVRFQKDGYAPAIGLCRDSIMMQSRNPSNSDF